MNWILNQVKRIRYGPESQQPQEQCISSER